MRLGETYYWLRFGSDPSRIDADQNDLFDFGALGTEEEGDSLLASPLGAPDAPVWVRASFAGKAAWEEAVHHFAARPDLSFGEAEVEDWDQSWRDRQEPVAVTANLTVIPPWLPSPETGKVIKLTAKMAFGTGLHESTQLAAELLEKLPWNGMDGPDMLDIGTGTGILAIYAAQLGASQAIAYDIDPVAGPCLAENLALNPLSPHHPVLPFIGTTAALKPSLSHRVVVCNMIRGEWWPFKEELIGRTGAGGYLVISGQRLEDRPLVLPWLRDSGFEPFHELDKNGWWAITAAKQAHART